MNTILCMGVIGGVLIVQTCIERYLNLHPGINSLWGTHCDIMFDQAEISLYAGFNQ